MKILLWGVALFLAVVWTLCIALVASAANWLAGSSDQVVGAVQLLAEWPLPAWAALWMDPAWLDGLRDMLTWSIDFIVNHAPWLFSILAWVAPLLWILWALGMILLLALVAVALVLLGRVPPAART